MYLPIVEKIWSMNDLKENTLDDLLDIIEIITVNKFNEYLANKQQEQ